MNREDIEFCADGTTLRGWFYVPSPNGPHPAVVMAHGYAGVKEQLLDRYAERFAAAGLAVLVYDHRNFGASDGTPRQEIDPLAQIRDYRNAISFVQTRREVDPARIGIWGSSFSGGHVLVVAAVDRRVGCVVSQVPTISGYLSSLRRVTAENLPALRNAFDADRAARFRGEPPAVVPMVSEATKGETAYRGADTARFFELTKPFSPTWRNEITLRSIEMAREYEPGIFVPRISPTPLLMIVATDDTTVPSDLALEAYERALQPKELLLVRGGHYVVYLEEFDQTSGAAGEYFARHLHVSGK